MEKDRFYRTAGIILALLAIAIVCYVEQIIKPAYAIKSIIKLLCFSSAIIIYSVISRKKLVDVIHLRKLKNARTLIAGMLMCFVGIFVLFMVFRNMIDFSAIRESLIKKENLTRGNCILVFTYIVIVNSFLEEAFFRGFIYQIFDRRNIGVIISALLFAVYHMGIVANWFSPLILFICIAGLAFVGLFLQWISNRYDSIAASWLTHASANVPINLIGALLIFEILK